MGKLGDWIDGLSDAEKDRIVRAQRWEHGSFVDGRGRSEPVSMCLLTHAAFGPVASHTWAMDLDRRYGTASVTGMSTHFDALCRRFGLDRIVRACKQRAAATMSGEVETPDRETVPA